MSREQGFAPFYDENSRVLILGSFPSVMSRREGFYYGNPRNRFWPTLAAFFGDKLPVTVEEKRAFLSRHGIALWDMVASCEIQGSADDKIRGEHVVDIDMLFGHAPIELVLCNGTKAFSLYAASPLEGVPYIKLPSTSPANPRFSEKVWFDALSEVFHDQI